jgi:hypothetical protein
LEDGQFHAWIERDDQMPTQFLNGDREYTLNSIAGGRTTIAVGGYDISTDGIAALSDSSRGPARSAGGDDRQKPELSAPGIVSTLPAFLASSAIEVARGTSVAAPVVTGIVALMMGHALRAHIDLTIDTIRAILEATARKDEVTGPAWNERLGHGRVSACEALAELMRLG